MAEQSLGWSTNGTGDGVNGGYPEARMISMQSNSFGAGVMFTGNRFQRTWTTTSVTVNTGACMIGGYFYENTASETINLTSGAAGTYYLVVYLNTNASSTACVSNVTANNPSSITIGAKTTRLAIVSSAAYGSPPSGTVFIPLHSIGWNGTAITAVTDIRQFVTPVTPNLSTIRLFKTASQSIATGTTGADIITYANKWQSTDGLMTADVTTGVVTLNTTGIYLVDFAVQWATGATGNRHLRLCSASENAVEVAATSMAAATFVANAGGTLVPATGYVQRASTTIIRDQINLTSTPSYETLFLRCAQDSGAAVNVTRAQITVTRLSDIPPAS
jgi:hypothetical protein